MLRLGLIGCGRIVEEGHAPALLRLRDRVQVVALADPSPERQHRIGDLLDVPPAARFADYREMLRRVRLDCVDIALPHFLHAPAVLDCAAAGVHILLEKPMATSLAEADRMLAAVERAGVTFSVIHNYLYRPAERAALRLIGEGQIGRPFLVRSEGLGGSHYRGATGYDPDWRTRASRSGGGCLIDNAYHNLYLCQALLQSPVETVYARIRTYFHPIEVEDTALLLLEHANGGTSSVQVSWAAPAGGQRVQEVHGTGGTIAFGRDGQPLAVYRQALGAWEYPPVEGAESNGFPAFFAAFFAALEQGAPPPVTGTEARWNLAVVLAAYEAGRTGRPVRVSA